jgi:predicted transcriptional regulator
MNIRVYQWLNEKDDHRKVLQVFNQPLISRQISKKTGIPTNTCSYVIAQFVDKGLLVCLNSDARNSRLYWLTEKGRQCRKKLFLALNQTYKEPELPEIDWQLYGWVCFSHRSAIIKALTHPMQPSEIKRLFRLQGTHIRISANNIRDIVRLFLGKRIVRPVKVKKRAHLLYELTDLGIKLRLLLIQADAAL